MRACLLAAALLAALPISAEAQELPGLLTKLRNATAYLEVHFVDPNRPTERCPAGPNEGTGFIVSPNGGLITAQHIFEPKSACAGYTEILVEARIGYRSTAFPTPAIPVIIDESTDIVAARLGGRPDDYNHLEVCFVDLPPQGTPLLALGFPVGQDFTYLEVAFQNFNNASARWNVSSDIAFGMSGGPIVDLSGRVVGVIKGGVPGTPAARFVTPLNWAQSPLVAAGVLNVAPCETFPAVVTQSDPEPTTDPEPQPADDAETFAVSAVIAASAQNRTIVSESFSHDFGDASVCTEGWRTQSFPACLPDDTKIDRVLGPDVNSAGHDGQSWYEQVPGRENCVDLLYGYSDRGLDVNGNCRGDGYISADWTLEGESLSERQVVDDVVYETLDVSEGATATATMTFPETARAQLARATRIDWSYGVEIRDAAGNVVADLSSADPVQGRFSSEQTSIGTVIVSVAP